MAATPVPENGAADIKRARLPPAGTGTSLAAVDRILGNRDRNGRGRDGKRAE